MIKLFLHAAFQVQTNSHAFCLCESSCVAAWPLAVVLAFYQPNLGNFFPRNCDIPSSHPGIAMVRYRDRDCQACVVFVCKFLKLFYASQSTYLLLLVHIIAPVFLFKCARQFSQGRPCVLTEF
jgi:hypothetical protein